MNETQALRILHLEDDAGDADLVQRTLIQEDLASEVHLVASRSEYLTALEIGRFDLILSDSRIPSLDGLEALQIARQQCPGIPFLFVSGHLSDADNVARLRAAGATDCVPKADLVRLAAAIRGALQNTDISAPARRDDRYRQGMERLVTVVQELSLARDLDTIMAIVRRAARELTGADGATFILREHDLCHYADEDAIAPLWKGRRFPLTACISGWSMLNRQQAVIEDIYTDPRIPHDAYRPTFVNSLAMVPIRTLNPIGAIGNYWAERHRASPEEVKLLQALADTTAVALENVQVHAELEQRVNDRTTELASANRELEAFSYVVSHDLRTPLRHIDSFAQMLARDCADTLNEQGQHYLARIRNATQRMSRLIEDLLALSRTAQAPVQRQAVNLSHMAREIAAELAAASPQHRADFIIAEDLVVHGDPGLLRAALENLLGNAWKFSSKRSRTRIELGSLTGADERAIYYIRDNGAGFESAYAGKLFGVFQRLHPESDFPGTGVGLATVERIIHKHGGRIWAEAAVDQGATFYFTLA